MQIAGEGIALADGMVIPVCWHGYVDLSGPDIDAPGIRLKYRRRRILPLTSASSS
jgi:hypothetical protein